MNNSGQAPFPKLCAISRVRLATTSDVSREPDSTSHADTTCTDHIPGHPGLNLSKDVHAYLLTELGTPLLDELYEALWLFARKSGASIDPLHTQQVKGRSVIPTEDPRLHLVWNRGKIYIKPMPVYLLHFEFWATYLQHTPPTSSSNNNHIRRSGTSSCNRSLALGFMRSYAFLLTHQLDFELAKEAHLIPNEVQDWAHWSALLCHFRNLPDHVVARRYHFGQLRLSRLNWAVRIFQPQNASTAWFYEISHWSTTDFLQQATIPMLFVFASLSLALSSMQVMLAVDSVAVASGDSKQVMNWVFWVFSIVILLSWAVTWALFLGIPLVIIIWQGLWGFKMERRRRATRSDGNAVLTEC